MTETRIGTLNFPTHTRGDTFEAADFTIGGLGLLVNPVVRMDVRADKRLLIRYHSGTGGGIQVITNTELTFVFRFTEKVINLAEGVHEQSIKISSDTDQVNTYLTGTWEIVREPTSYDN